MGYTFERNVNAALQEDCLRALSRNKDIRVTEQEQTMSNKGTMEEEAALGRVGETLGS